MGLSPIIINMLDTIVEGDIFADCLTGGGYSVEAV